jgi:serine/threonine protein kinase
MKGPRPLQEARAQQMDALQLVRLQHHLRAPDMDLAIDQSKLTLKWILGAGAHGEVWFGTWEGHDGALHKVAIKVLLTGVASHGSSAVRRPVSLFCCIGVASACRCSACAGLAFSRCCCMVCGLLGAWSCGGVCTCDRHARGALSLPWWSPGLLARSGNTLMVSMCVQKRRKFADEMRLMAVICHRNIVRCYGGAMARSEGERDCIVLEYVPGGTLDNYVHKARARDRLKVTEVLSVAIHVADALRYLHPMVVHRDLKPSNIMLDEHGTIKITDFGISKLKRNAYLSRGALISTPAYTSPEVYNNHTARPHSERANGVSLALPA